MIQTPQNAASQAAAPAQQSLPLRSSSAAAPDSAKPRNDAKPAEPKSPEDIAQVIESANRAIKSLSRDLEFSFDREAGRSVVRVVDRTNGQLIRQIPSEEMLDIAKDIDRLQGLIIRRTA